MTVTNQKIIPNLWCNGNAREVVDFYLRVFGDSKITGVTYYPTEGLADFQKDMAGKELTIDFEIYGYAFTAMNAEREFKPNSSISFIVNCESRETVDMLWSKLSGSGSNLMALDEYPFSERYAWVRDQFGFSWQLIYANPEMEWRPKIMPSLMFADENTGKAEDAIKYYTSIFPGARIGHDLHYGELGTPPNLGKEGNVIYADFTLASQWFADMDAASVRHFSFNEAVSFLVKCETQEEIDNLWEKLSAAPESEQCGWLKDKYGVSWQIVPKNLDELLFNPDGSAKPKPFQAMMQMKKLDIKNLKTE